MKHLVNSASALILLALFSCGSQQSARYPFSRSFVQVAESDHRYFQLSNGDPYIPIGCNIAAISDIAHMESYLLKMYENGANYGRVWLNSSLFEIETEYGVLNERNLAHIDRLLELALRYDIKIKMCIESFRHIAPGKNKWDTKASYRVSNGGPFEDMADYMTTARGKEEFLKRLGILQRRYGDHPAVFGWELWNEMNAVAYSAIEPWNEYMLPEVKRMFPRNLVMQSLGSLDTEYSFPVYEKINRMDANEVAQVHRYIDLGAELPTCKVSVDSMAADAVEFIKAYGLAKPILLAETGAVEPVHTGPHEAYASDTLGIILHDALFAPFFPGAAGPGHMWHWDAYIDRNDLWYHFGRFATAIGDLDPAAENITCRRLDQQGLKVYVLDGKSTALVWCRDTVSDWQTELVDGIIPELLSGIVLDLGKLAVTRKIASVAVYDPWDDIWSELPAVSDASLPDFTRSTVVKITYE